MAKNKSTAPECPPDVLVRRALSGDLNSKYTAMIIRDWLKFRLNEISHRAHKHEVQYWLDAPGTDDEKLAQILGSSRDMMGLVEEAAQEEN